MQFGKNCSYQSKLFTGSYFEKEGQYLRRLYEKPTSSFCCSSHSFKRIQARLFHKGYGIGIVEEGVKELHYLGKDYSASGLSLIIVNPNQIHTGEHGP